MKNRSLVKRREFVQGAALAAGAMVLASKTEAARKPAPDYMPVVKKKMTGGNYLPYYQERELTAPVLLCDERGRLNPAAVGWARTPLIRANLSGHWPRKKRWNFWNWISPEFVFSVTVADIDFASFCAASFSDFQTRQNLSAISIKPPGYTEFPEEVEQSIFFKSKTINYAFQHEGRRIRVNFAGAKMGGGPAEADFVIHKPEGHETLSFVAPWSSERFQMNSKHNTLPVEGHVTVGGRRYEMKPESCHGVQDFGRGMWPYRSYWNWGVASGKQGDDRIGVNIGAKWTTGTGANENAICYNGRLYKIMEDLIWEYEPADWKQPWRVRTGHSEMLDLTLTPILVTDTKISLGFLSTGGACAFGHWRGVLRFDGRQVEVKDIIGWAEEFSHRW